ncbi:hypothetical protein Tco_1485144 [Tanacetum coccineum]
MHRSIKGRPLVGVLHKKSVRRHDIQMPHGLESESGLNLENSRGFFANYRIDPPKTTGDNYFRQPGMELSRTSHHFGVVYMYPAVIVLFAMRSPIRNSAEIKVALKFVKVEESEGLLVAKVDVIASAIPQSDYRSKGV